MHAYAALDAPPDGHAYTHLGALPPHSPAPMYYSVPPASLIPRSDAPSAASKPNPGLSIDPAAPPADAAGVLPDPHSLSPYGPNYSAAPPTALYSPGFTPALYAVSPVGSPNPGAPPSPAAGCPFPPQSGYNPGFLSPAQGYGYYGSPALGSPYGSAVGVMSAPTQGASGPGRTVYVGNLPGEASVDELLSLVKFGPIENVRVLPEKTCAFISFLDPTTAAAFHADACVKRLTLHGAELKIGWGRNTPVPHNVLTAVQQHNATRNVYLGNLEESWTEEDLRDELSRFGLIDQVKIVVDRNIAFVHFLSISTAMKVVATLPNESGWGERRVNYGKDRCAYVPKSQQQNQAHNHQAAAMGLAAAVSLGYSVSMGTLGNPCMGLNSPMLNSASSGSHSPDRGAGINPGQDGCGTPAAMAAASAAAAALSQLGNRTVYLGNIHSETTTEEICNHVRGGLLQTIRYIPEKHIAFVTFIEPHAALAFFHMASFSSGVMIRNRRLKIGWGKHSGPVSPAIAMAVQAGGSRNVYVGNITDPALHTEEKLRADFSDYGEIEQINFLREKNCAFVNFCNIQNAIKAIGAMKNHPDYATIKISYGKDRCGNPPRSVLQQVQAQGGHAPYSFGRPVATEQPASAEHILPSDIPGEEGNPGLGVLVPPTDGEE